MPTMAFGNYVRPRCDKGELTSGCADNELFRPSPSGTGYGAADRAVARLLHAVDAVQRLGRLRAPGPAGHATTATTTLDGRGPAVARRARRGAALYRPADGWAAAADLGHGDRQPGPHRRRLPGGLPHEPGRQQAPDAAAGPRSPRTATSRSARGVDAHAAVRPAATPCRRPPGTPSSRTSTTTGSSTCSCPRATSTRCPTTRSGTRATCSLASRTARSPRAPRPRASCTFDRGRGAALADFNQDGLLDLVEVEPRGAGADLAQRRGRNGRCAGGRWAAGCRCG